nr:hypothetical protein [Tanacetum cinerariifolium]
MDGLDSLEQRTSNGIHVDPSKIEAVKNWKAPSTPSEVHSFLRLAGYYRWFIESFSKIVKSLICDSVAGYSCLVIMTVRFATILSSIKDRILAAQKEAMDESEGITMDFVTKFPRTSSGHDIISVIVDQLTKSAHFLPMSEDYKTNRLARLYLNEIVARHGVSISIISDRDSRFTSRFWQSMQEALGTRLDMSTAYHPQTDGYSERTIQTLEDMLRVHVLDFRGKSIIRQLCGLRLKKEERKLAPTFVRPFEIIEKVSPVAYRLTLPDELDGVHDTFHVSNLKNCLDDPTLQVPLDEVQVDAKLNFLKEPVEILEREFNKLKQSRITIVKVWWNLKRRPKFKWKRED